MNIRSVFLIGPLKVKIEKNSIPSPYATWSQSDKHFLLIFFHASAVMSPPVLLGDPYSGNNARKNRLFYRRSHRQKEFSPGPGRVWT
jgi:hypothetical protein